MSERQGDWLIGLFELVQRRAGLFFVLVALALSASFLADARNRAAVGLAEGESFGVQIGMPIETAEAKARAAGFQQFPYSNAHVGSCAGRSIRRTETLHVFRDDSWRSGSLCLFESAGTVVAVAWSFAPFASLVW